MEELKEIREIKIKQYTALKVEYISKAYWMPQMFLLRLWYLISNPFCYIILGKIRW